MITYANSTTLLFLLQGFRTETVTISKSKAERNKSTQLNICRPLHLITSVLINSLSVIQSPPSVFLSSYITSLPKYVYALSTNTLYSPILHRPFIATSFCIDPSLPPSLPPSSPASVIPHYNFKEGQWAFAQSSLLLK